MLMIPVIFIRVLATGYLLAALSVISRQITHEHK
jgi:hypothetical protein